MRNPENYYFGKVCDKHPEVKGERRRRDDYCVGCHRQSNRKYYAKHSERFARKREVNREKDRAYFRKYHAGYHVHLRRGHYYSCIVGAAGECFVLAELCIRGLNAAKCVNPGSPHDLFVEIGGRCYTIQVKVGRRNARTLTITATRLSRITSQLIAVVDLVGKRIRWVSNTSEPVPAVLLEGGAA